MQENFSTTKLPTVASTSDTGHTTPSSIWQNVNNILLDDANSATWGAFLPGQASEISGKTFGFNLPPGVVVDGIEVFVAGSQFGCFGDVKLNIPGTVAKDMGALGIGYGGPTDLWGASSISLADIASIQASVNANDISGGDGTASINYMAITVFWHIDQDTAPADVPTRVAYKVYSRDGDYLGELPNVTSQLAFPQDINSAGSTIEIVCGRKAENTATVEAIQDNLNDDILDNNGLPIFGTAIDTVIALGASEDKAIFKNSNRIKVWLYNYWHPNGKLMFSGQVNRVKSRHKAGESTTRLVVLSDGLDLSNYIARGYPFALTIDVSQGVENTSTVTSTQGGKGAGWERWGQTWKTGPAITNLASITLKMQGTANVTINLYDAPNGNLLASVTQAVSKASPANVRFEFAQLIKVQPSTTYFFATYVEPGQSIRHYHSTANPYPDGMMYGSSYSGGSGGGLFTPVSTGNRDMYFFTTSGTPTTTTTFATQDPTTGMMAGILLDYNARGGYITRRDFDATGLSLTYTFNMAFIIDAFKKVLELSPSGFYGYIDLGTAEMDIKAMSTTADFTVVNGNDAIELDLDLSIEQVKNYLLLTGGPAPTTNLFREYQDSKSATYYGQRAGTKTDNRVTLVNTANAIGNTFIEENSDETQETSLIVPVTAMDTTLLVPGKTVGFRNYGSFVDQLILQIVRREFNTKFVTLTLGRLPIRMNDEVQRINRGLLNEQTANNPSAPS